MNGRNFMRLVQLVPGATEGAANAINSGSRPDDRRQTSSVSINGESENRNNQMIDGMDNNERSIGTVGVKPSMDAIAEVRVQTNLYTAEAGRASGGRAAKSRSASAIRADNEAASTSSSAVVGASTG